MTGVLFSFSLKDSWQTTLHALRLGRYFPNNQLKSKRRHFCELPLGGQSMMHEHSAVQKDMRPDVVNRIR